MDRLVRGSVDVVVVGPRTSAKVQALAHVAQRAHLPDRVVAWLDPSDLASVGACAVLAEGKTAKGDGAAYVCRGRSCSLPIRDTEELARSLD